MRKAIVSGQFYKAQQDKLMAQLESCFKHPLGAGMPKVPLPETRIIGAIAPHAGYQYSGMCASHVYKELATKNFPATFIIFGPNHSGQAKALFSLSLEDFETPFGIVKNDVELGNALIETASSEGLQGLFQDELAHRFEHSIEVQLPFLQFIAKMLKKDFKVVPIIVSTLDFDSCIALARTIAKTVKQNRNVCAIASSDISHYGMNYRFLPFPVNEHTKDNLYALDRKSINHILKLDAWQFYKEATKTTICGVAPIVITIEICKQLGAKKAKLLKYYTSGDIVKDYASAVGYAALVFE